MLAESLVGWAQFLTRLMKVEYSVHCQVEQCMTVSSPIRRSWSMCRLHNIPESSCIEHVSGPSFCTTTPGNHRSP